MEKLIPFSQRTAENIYLEYVNDWLTVAKMAENYGRTEKEMTAIIDKGREEHIQRHEHLQKLKLS